MKKYLVFAFVLSLVLLCRADDYVTDETTEDVSEESLYPAVYSSTSGWLTDDSYAYIAPPPYYGPYGKFGPYGPHRKFGPYGPYGPTGYYHGPYGPYHGPYPWQYHRGPYPYHY